MTTLMRPLSTTVHAESGIGKSWLCDTGPAPRLILDVEGGSKFTPSQPKVHWDPITGPPPLDQETIVVMLRTFKDMQYSYDWLNSGQHDIQSVALDSVTELQKRCKDAIREAESITQFRIQDWGTLLDDMELLVRQFRDLWMHPVQPVPVLTVVATTKRDDDGVYRPDVQGKLSGSLPYYTDVVGFLYPEANPETLKMDRKMLVQPAPGYIAKDRTDRLGTILTNPTIPTMLDMIYGPAVTTEGVA